MFKLNKLSGMRSFLLLWGAQAISLMGSEMTNFALTFISEKHYFASA